MFGNVFKFICILLFIILYHYKNYINTKRICLKNVKNCFALKLCISQIQKDLMIFSFDKIMYFYCDGVRMGRRGRGGGGGGAVRLGQERTVGTQLGRRGVSKLINLSSLLTFFYFYLYSDKC